MNRNHMELHGSDYISCPLHVNTELEIIYVRSGKVHIIYDGAEYDLTEGKAMLILPCRVHRFFPNENVDATVLMFSYQLATETLGNFLNFSAASDVFNVDEALGRYIDSLLETVKDKIEVTDNFLVPGIYYAFMNAYFVNNRFIACRKNDIIQQVINMVALETDDMLTIEKIAGRYCLSGGSEKKKVMTCWWRWRTGSFPNTRAGSGMYTGPVRRLVRYRHK